MSVATPNDCEPVTVPLRGVERELNRQIKCVQDHKGEAPVIRAGLSNLMIYCNSAEAAAEVCAVVPAIVAIHPARVLLLVHDPAAEPGPVTATVHTQMHRLGKGLRAYSEQVTLHANGRAAEHLPFAVRSLLIGDQANAAQLVEIDQAGPAAQAGLLTGDLVIVIDEKRVDGVSALMRALGPETINRAVSVDFLRRANRQRLWLGPTERRAA